jgi:hypothetical protein
MSDGLPYVDPPRTAEDVLIKLISFSYRRLLIPEATHPITADIDGVDPAIAEDVSETASAVKDSVALLYTSARAYPAEFSGASFGASAAFAFVDLVRQFNNEVTDNDLWKAAFTLAVTVADNEDDRKLSAAGGRSTVEDAAHIFEARDAQLISPEAAKQRLAALLDLAPNVGLQPTSAGIPSRATRFAEWVQDLLGSTVGTFVRLAIGIFAIVALVGFGIQVWSSNDASAADGSNVSGSPSESSPSYPDLTGTSNFQVTSWAFRSGKDPANRSVSGRSPADPLLVGPGERFYVDVTLEKRDGAAALPEELSYAVSGSDDMQPTPGSFRLFNEDNPDGIEIPDMTTTFSPVSFNRGGGGISLSFSAVAPTPLYCGYNPRRLVSFFTAGEERLTASSMVYVTRGC